MEGERRADTAGRKSRRLEDEAEGRGPPKKLTFFGLIIGLGM